MDLSRRWRDGVHGFGSLFQLRDRRRRASAIDLVLQMVTVGVTVTSSIALGQVMLALTALPCLMALAVMDASVRRDVAHGATHATRCRRPLTVGLAPLAVAANRAACPSVLAVLWAYTGNLTALMLSLMVAGVALMQVSEATRAQRASLLLARLSPVLVIAGLGTVLLVTEMPPGPDVGVALLVGAGLLCVRGIIVARRRLAETKAWARERALHVQTCVFKEQDEDNKLNFLAMISHELRTPLNGILGMVQLLEMTELDARQRTYASDARDAGQRMLRLVSDLLDVSATGGRTFELDPSDVDLPFLVQDIAATGERLARDHNMVFRVEASPALPQSVRADQARLAQIIHSLIDNALKYGGCAGGGGAAMVVNAVAQNSGKRAQLSVSIIDFGDGIADTLAPHLFKPFSRADMSRTRAFDGAGLGLPLAARLTEIMGGRLTVETEPGLGTRVNLRVPLEVIEWRAPAGTARHGRPAARSRGGDTRMSGALNELGASQLILSDGRSSGLSSGLSTGLSTPSTPLEEHTLTGDASQPAANTPDQAERQQKQRGVGAGDAVEPGEAFDERAAQRRRA